MKLSAICYKIKSARLAKGYSQAWLAGHLSTTQNIYSKIESGEMEMALYRLIIICDVLDINIKILLADA